MQRQLLLPALITALLCGCAGLSQAPYQRPDAPAKAAWTQPPAAVSVSASETISPQWWTEFRDPQLDALVARAIAGNLDLVSLAGRIKVAQAQIAEVEAGAMPTLDLGSGASLEKVTGQSFSKRLSLGSQVSWDLDIWGRVARGVQAQTAEFRASEADWRAGYLQLVATVSTSYFQILQLDEQIEHQQGALKKSERVQSIFETMRANGLLPQTQVLRQQAENNRLRKELIELKRLRDVSENALATLVGTPAGEFRIAAGRLNERVQLPVVPAGLPLDLLARRPDVVAAEFRVLEAYHLVGEARLAQLPSVSLTGRGGSSAFSLGDLLRTFTFGLLPSINLPALNPGILARIKTTEAQSKVFENDYRRTVIAAYEEVETSLVNLQAHRRQREELAAQVDQLRTVSAQTGEQLKAGLVSQLDLFETERSLLSAELALLASHQLVLADTVTLYKALGGGWAPTQVSHASR